MNETEAAVKMAEAARLLEEVACGTLSATVAIQRWPFNSGEESRDAANALHALHHFQIDADIRSRDEAYAAAQVSRLRSTAAKLRGA